MKKYFWSLFILAITVSCVGNDKTNMEGGAEDSSKVVDAEAKMLEIPDVPDDIKDSVKMAEFLAFHFWDNLNFSDSLKSRDVDFISPNFSKYISILHKIKDKDIIKQSFLSFQKKVVADPATFNLVLKMAEDSLYNLDSPMLSEDIYESFLSSLLDSGFLDNDNRWKYEDQYKIVSKNKVGDKVTDFSFVMPSGKTSSLLQASNGKPTVLIFFDPDCDTCEEAIFRLENNPDVTSRIKNGSLSLIAIYSGHDMEGWKKKVASLPKDWIVGINPEIDEKELYFLREMPSIYILDKSGIITDKNVRLF